MGIKINEEMRAEVPEPLSSAQMTLHPEVYFSNRTSTSSRRPNINNFTSNFNRPFTTYNSNRALQPATTKARTKQVDLKEKSFRNHLIKQIKQMMNEDPRLKTIQAQQKRTSLGSDQGAKPLGRQPTANDDIKRVILSRINQDIPPQGHADSEGHALIKVNQIVKQADPAAGLANFMIPVNFIQQQNRSALVKPQDVTVSSHSNNQPESTSSKGVYFQRKNVYLKSNSNHSQLDRSRG